MTDTVRMPAKEVRPGDVVPSQHRGVDEIVKSVTGQNRLTITYESGWYCYFAPDEDVWIKKRSTVIEAPSDTERRHYRKAAPLDNGEDS